MTKYATLDAIGRPTGFYDPAMVAVPDGAVEITDAQWMDCLSNQGQRVWNAETSSFDAYAPPPPAPRPREEFGDDLITALTDAELSAMSGGTLRDQRMLSAQRVPFRATDDIIVRLAAVMKIDPAAWLARVPG